MLREGRVVAAGPLPEVMTEQLLSETFGMPLVAAARRTAATPPAARCASARLTVASRWIGSAPWTGCGTTSGRAGWLSRSLLGALELVSLDLFLVMLAGGALVGALTALLGGPLALQVVLALVTVGRPCSA